MDSCSQRVHIWLAYVAGVSAWRSEAAQGHGPTRARKLEVRYVGV